MTNDERITNSKARNLNSFGRLFGYWTFGLLSSFLLTGCVSKARAKADAQAAFLAGQQQAMIRMQQQQLQQARGAFVSFVGPVSNPSIPWTEDLTLVKAILAAGYTGNGDPRQILIMRNGQALQLDPKHLTEDQPLQPGDVIQLIQ